MPQPTSVTLTRSQRIWKFVQGLFWIVGLVLLLLMYFRPSLGVTLFWNILIPVAPALLVVATGVWRNICPLSTTALLPERLGISQKKKLSYPQRNILNLVGVILLFLIIPLRHLLFNNSGRATAVIILALAAVAILFGILYERKSGWCSGLCPVHPVEKFYGSGVGITMVNAHCNECVRCSAPCPDSTKNTTPFVNDHTKTSKAIEYLLVGAFPGYIWGWFHVPDYDLLSWQNLFVSYGYPILSAVVSLLAYLLLRKIVQRQAQVVLVNLFAALAVACYYWFRLPLLFGFGVVENNGMLVDLSQSLPQWSMWLLNLGTTVFFIWWMVLRRKPKLSWAIRPRYATAEK